MECKECNKTVSFDNLIDEAVKDMKANEACQSCLYWLERIERKDSECQAIIGGVVYQIDPRIYKNKSHQGHSGREFTISFFDGRIVTTDNLWYNGKIDSDFISRLPDNAKFI